MERRLILLVLSGFLLVSPTTGKSNSFIECDATILPDLIDDPRIGSPSIDFDQLDWSYSDLPMTITAARCKVTDSVSRSVVVESNSLIKSNKETHTAGNQGYFFYIAECGDKSFCVSWNGHRESDHAQWLITEDSRRAVIRGKSCFADPRVLVCLR